MFLERQYCLRVVYYHLDSGFCHVTRFVLALCSCFERLFAFLHDLLLVCVLLLLHPPRRSVALTSSAPAALQHPSLFFAAVPAKSAPELTTSFGVKKEWSGAASPAVWQVCSDDLELVPVDFPLERTHREITADATTVAKRISDLLRAMSIEAEYTCEKAKCKTNDCVGFRIRLYAGSETGMPVVVEVQRRCGSASSFMRSCRAILDAAEGKDVKQTVVATAGPQKKLPPFMKKPIGQMKCLQTVAPKAADPEVSLDNIIGMLRSGKRDTNTLGLENLCCLTDPVKTAPSAAVSVSKTIILGDPKYDLREAIRSLTDCDAFSVEDNVLLFKHADHMRHLTLTIFANALAVCCKDGCLTHAVKEQTWFVEYLIPSLLNELKRAESNASNAYQAAWCLQSLIAGSAIARQALIENGGVAILEEAHAVGLRRHELLTTETKRCLASLR